MRIDSSWHVAVHGSFSCNVTSVLNSQASSRSHCVVVLAVYSLFLCFSILLVFSEQLFRSFVVTKKNTDSGTLQKPEGKIAVFLLPWSGHLCFYGH